MKLSSEIARTKKKMFFFVFSVSSVQTDNKKKKKNRIHSGRNDSVLQS